MTDHVQEIMQKIVAVAGDPLATIESVGGRLRELWDQAANANDEQAMVCISNTWNEIQTMNAQTGAAVDMAAAAQKVADEVTRQRDALAEQHGKLVQDINVVNTDNPLVDKVWDAATQSYEEDLMYSDTFISTDPGEDIVDGINAIPVTYQEARTFFDMLMGGYELDVPQAEKLANFIQQFVKEVVDADNAEIDMNDPDEAA